MKSVNQRLGLKELVILGLGSMVGGGIFTVLGMAVEISGPAIPIALLFGGLLAAFTGYSYVCLALRFRNDQGLTYLSLAFPQQPLLGIIASWNVVLAYIGTLALYAFTFGAYGAELLHHAQNPQLRQVLSIAILLLFIFFHLRNAKPRGRSYGLLTTVKILLLLILVLKGSSSTTVNHLVARPENGYASILTASAMIFIAYEGFQHIVGAATEASNIHFNLPRAIYLSIAIVTLIYVLLAIVVIGSVDIPQLINAKEYAVALAMEPALGETGRVVVSLIAIMASSSAIHVTLLHTSGIVADMAEARKMPKIFAIKSWQGLPWLATSILAGFAVILILVGKLELIVAFSSLTFLLVAIAVSTANFRLHDKTDANLRIVGIGLCAQIAASLALLWYLLANDTGSLFRIGFVYALVWIAVIIHYFSQKLRRKHLRTKSVSN